jgi:hypothetical protein|tara:strand:+ start:372 stop:851 length:480 start_codon:yes stop_codon:yes gene_type:complete
MATSAEFWTSSYGPGDTNGSYEFLSGRSPNRYHLMRLLRKKGMREVGEILSTIIEDAVAGQTPQSSASVTTSQLTAEANTQDNVQGGVRTIAAKEEVGLLMTSDKDDASSNTARAVTTVDTTELQTMLIPSGSRASRAPATYATDASGNGGGGKFDQGF